MNYKSIFLFCGLMSLAHTVYGTTTGTLEIRITGGSICQGNLMLAIYNNQSHFMNTEQAVAKEVINLASSDCAMPIFYKAQIPYGQYAVVVYNDANSNGILDKNSFGAPTESWGVSNNARPFLREPTFGDCAVTLVASHTSLTIDVQ
jgi:uncharacterized protein (DUF2141 family)